MNRDRSSLAQILERIELAVEFAGRDKAAFLKRRIAQEAVVRELEIIGEASKRLSRETRNLPGGAPWKQMAGFRDIAIHQYDALDLERVWEIVRRDLPKIRLRVRVVIAKLRD